MKRSFLEPYISNENGWGCRHQLITATATAPTGPFTASCATKHRRRQCNLPAPATWSQTPLVLLMPERPGALSPECLDLSAPAKLAKPGEAVRLFRAGH
ncbi:hypothetical protein PoB_001348400 [Plakobranchus ocellatus]|uniref:Uncharacterized protein n=1 Tax=Plakobranchus ocellatus TaxID=259542 RepID=A0AAV3YZ06_9GAST|nr:hypothetical protein PoB_001348400 [Plakobranchus ocellatus]